MHEIGVLDQAVKMAERVATENGATEIKYLALTVGELSGYLPVFFEQYFPIVTEDRPMFKNTKLIVETKKGEALCNECQSLYNVLKNEGVCPKCKSRDKTILGGQEFMVKEIGI